MGIAVVVFAYNYLAEDSVLVRMANAFTRMDRTNEQAMDDLHQGWVKAMDADPSAWTYVRNFVPMVGLARLRWPYKTFTFLAAGFVDALRFGDGVKKGGAWNWLHDGGRLLTWIPQASAAKAMAPAAGRLGTTLLRTVGFKLSNVAALDANAAPKAVQRAVAAGAASDDAIAKSLPALEEMFCAVSDPVRASLASGRIFMPFVDLFREYWRLGWPGIKRVGRKAALGGGLGYGEVLARMDRLQKLLGKDAVVSRYAPPRGGDLEASMRSILKQRPTSTLVVAQIEPGHVFAATRTARGDILTLHNGGRSVSLQGYKAPPWNSTLISSGMPIWEIKGTTVALTAANQAAKLAPATHALSVGASSAAARTVSGKDPGGEDDIDPDDPLAFIHVELARVAAERPRVFTSTVTLAPLMASEVGISGTVHLDRSFQRDPFESPDYSVYLASEGETLESIAKLLYGDPAYAIFLESPQGQVGASDPLEAGTPVLVPHIHQSPWANAKAQAEDFRAAMARALAGAPRPAPAPPRGVITAPPPAPVEQNPWRDGGPGKPRWRPIEDGGIEYEPTPRGRE